MRHYVKQNIHTEDNEDVLSIKDIDIAFICCNKPFTMTVEQCANVVKAIRPEVFIPYHYGGTDIPTDLDALQESLKDVTEPGKKTKAKEALFNHILELIQETDGVKVFRIEER